MANFTDTMNDPTNQIRVFNPPAEQSSLGILAQAAAPLIGSLIADVKEGADNTKINTMSQQMENEYRILAEQRRQGKISTTDFFTKLDAKSRQLAADFPTVSKQWKQKVREDFGSLQEQGFKQEMSSFQLEERQFDQDYMAAQSHGLTVLKDGVANKEATVAGWRSLQRQVLMAQLAAKDGGDKAPIQVNQSLQQVYNDNINNAMQTHLDAVAMNPKLSDAEKVAQAEAIINKAERDFNSKILTPTLGAAPLKAQDSKAIMESFQQQFQAKRELFIGDEKGSFTSKTRYSAAVAGAELDANNPGVAALTKKYGKNVVSGIIENGQLFSGANALLGQQMAKSMEALMTNLNNVSNNPDLLPQLPVPEKKQVVGAYSNVVKETSSTPKLDDGQENAFLESVTGLNGVFFQSRNKGDMERQLRAMNNDIIYKHIKSAKGGDKAQQADKAVTSINALANKYLVDQRDVLASQVGDFMQNISFNNATGNLELNPNRTDIPGLKQFRELHAGMLDKGLIPYNVALDVAAKSSIAAGDTRRPNEIKKELAGLYGYLPVRRNITPDKPDNANTQVFDNVNPKKPPNLPEVLTDAEGNKFIMDSNGTLQRLQQEKE